MEEATTIICSDHNKLLPFQRESERVKEREKRKILSFPKLFPYLSFLVFLSPSSSLFLLRLPRNDSIPAINNWLDMSPPIQSFIRKRENWEGYFENVQWFLFYFLIFLFFFMFYFSIENEKERERGREVERGRKREREKEKKKELLVYIFFPIFQLFFHIIYSSIFLIKILLLLITFSFFLPFPSLFFFVSFKCKIKFLCTNILLHLIFYLQLLI